MTTYLFHLMFMLPLALVVMAVRSGRRGRKRAGVPARRPNRETWGAVQMFALEEGTNKFMLVFSGDITVVWTTEMLRGILFDGYGAGETIPVLHAYGANWLAFTITDIDGNPIAPTMDIGYSVLWLGDAYHVTPPSSARATVVNLNSGTSIELDIALFLPGDVVQDASGDETELIRVVSVDGPTMEVQRGYRGTSSGTVEAGTVFMRVGSCINPPSDELIREAGGAQFSPVTGFFNLIPSIG